MTDVEKRPGGRSSQVRAAVVTATIDELLAAGYEALSYERIAARAGVHKTTIYRRWPTKAELVMEVVDQLAQERVKVPNTGSLEDDLAAFARSVVANLSSPEADALVRVLTVAARGSPELGERARAWWSKRFALAYAIVERAVERGEVPPDTDAEMVVETLVGPLYVRHLFTGSPLDREVTDRVAAVAAAVARGIDPEGFARGVWAAS